MVYPFVGRSMASSAVKETAITTSSNVHEDIFLVLGEFLADTGGATSSTPVAGGTRNTRIEYTFHLPALAFPATVGAFAHLSTFGLPVGVMR